MSDSCSSSHVQLCGSLLKGGAEGGGGGVKEFIVVIEISCWFYLFISNDAAIK